MFVAPNLVRLRILSPYLPTSALLRPPFFRAASDYSTPPSLSRPPPRVDRSSCPDVARANHAITRLSRLCHMADARQLFDETPHRDVISWTAIISGYIRCGMLREARALFDRPDAKKNVVTWTAILSGYVRTKRINEAEELFEQMPDKNVVSWNTMVSGYAENGLVDKACDLFREMPERNVVSWNTIITALAQSGRIDEAYMLFGQMPERDVISWTSMVTGLSQNRRVDQARAIFDRMPERNVVSWNAMISGYAQNCRLEDALYLFRRMPERDTTSWNTMITGFIQNKDLCQARALFDEMIDRNVVTWTTMMTGYIDENLNEKALELFCEMLTSGVKPNQATFVNILTSAGNLAAFKEGQQIHQIVSKTIFQFDPFVQSALISMYSKCGEAFIAREVFDLSDQKDLVLWNGMIAAYAHHGNGREAVKLFEEMQQNHFKPNDVTYVSLLSACSHSGLVNEGILVFEALINDSSIEMREDHYACLVDLCGRSGRLEEAASFIKRLKINPSSTCVWGALLSGCNVHGDARIGKLAARKLLEAEPKNAGTYMLLSNIYASDGKWKQAAKIRSLMKSKGLKKQPGCSWIEIGNSVNVFVVHDKSHSETKRIYNLLNEIHYEMKRAGNSSTIEDDLTMDESVVV